MQEYSPGLEHSERAAHVTGLVSVWLANDGDHLDTARTILAENGLSVVFVQYVQATLKRAQPGSAAWRVAQDLAPNDYDRVHWEDVAHQIRNED